MAQASIAVDCVRAPGSFCTLLQSEYNIRIASVAGGTLKLMDELKFSVYEGASQGGVTSLEFMN